MAVIPVMQVMMGDTGGWFLIDTGGLSPVDYRSISDRSHECGYRLFGCREGAMVVAFPSTRFARASRYKRRPGCALVSTTNKKRQSPSELLFKGTAN